jgi:cytochrome c-type biogenesis protein CcmF
MITAVGALGLLIYRWPRLPEGELYPAIKSREFCLAAGALVFAAVGAIVLVGMSTPLITMLMGKPQNVSTAFYNTTTMPLAAAMATLLVSAALTGWGTNQSGILKKYWWLVLLGHAAGAQALWAGIRHPVALAVVGVSAAALVASLLAVSTRRLSWPAGLTHAGVAAAFIGIIFSSMGNQTVYTSLEPGESQEIFGSKVAYLGTRTATDQPGFYHTFRLEGAVNATLEALTKTNKEGRHAAHEPGIHRSLLADTYLAPSEQQEASNHKELSLRKGEEVQEGVMTLKFIKFGMANSGMPGDVRVMAQLEVAKDGVTQEAKLELISKNGQLTPVPLKVFNQYELILTSVNTREGIAGVGINDLLAPPKAQRVDLEISRKPLINLVWLGTILITAGTAWAGLTRRKNLPASAGQEAGKRPTAI